MPLINITDHLKICNNVSVFNSQELDTIKEMLVTYEETPNKDYILLEERQHEELIGFLIFGKSSLTNYSWDIYWLIVDKNFQEKGLGKKMLERMEAFILEKEQKAILRIQISAKNEFASFRGLCQKMNFLEIGRIPEFYDKSNDLIVYYKELTRA